MCCVCFIISECPKAVLLPQDQIYIIYPNEELVVLLCCGTNITEKHLKAHLLNFPLDRQPSRVSITQPSPQCFPGCPQTPPGDSMHQGDLQLLRSIFSPIAPHGDSMPATKFSFQLRAEASKLCNSPSMLLFSESACRDLHGGK